jgi:hypothetical protein
MLSVETVGVAIIGYLLGNTEYGKVANSNETNEKNGFHGFHCKNDAGNGQYSGRR